jgi:LPS sulfotransferase NodH
LISSTPRTGSFLLAEALESTGVAGRPREYFDPVFERTWFDRMGARTDADYLAKVLLAGSTVNGVFAAKVHWHQFLHLTTKLRQLDRSAAPDAELLRHALPELRYVFLTRRDKVRQAISYYRAIQTGVWWIIRPDPDRPQSAPPPAPVPPPPFDFEQIDHWVTRLTFFEASWRRYFEKSGVRPVEVIYEDFAASYESTVRTVLRDLHLPSSECVRVASPRLQKQSDEVSEEWVERYRTRRAHRRPVPRPVRLSYFISSAPRTGSGLLAEALESTRLAGTPREYFDPNFEDYWYDVLSISAETAYLDKIISAGTTSNGVFGAKVHWYQFEHLSLKLRLLGGNSESDLELLRRAFPDLRYVFLTRKDKVRQAVSYYRAIQTDVWWSFEKGKGEAGGAAPTLRRSDCEKIDYWVGELAKFESHWRRHFARAGVRPFEVAYEDFVLNYESTVRAILRYLGLLASDDLKIAPPRLQKQADEVSEEWIDRYREFKGDNPTRASFAHDD